MAPSYDPNYGPPPGKPNGAARAAGEIPFDQVAKTYMEGLDGATNDPAFTKWAKDPVDPATKARAKLIYRDIPLVSIQNTWSVEQARGAIYSHLIGIFYQSGLLCDSILGDDRVTATLNSRAASIFGREVRFKAANDSDAAKECLRAWQAWWPRLSGTSAIREMFDYGTMMGFSHGQLVWATDTPGLDYAPTLHPWHPVFEWYDWMFRCYQAIGQDSMIPIIPGNGKWVEFAPFGSYRGWVRGALRPVTEPWLLRHFGFRDMARFGEVHGNPTRVGYVPMVGDPVERSNFEASLAKMGADNALMLPRGVDLNDGMGYDYKLVEAEGSAWQAHPAQIDRCDMAIVLALFMTNTQVVEGGSYGAVKANLQVRSEASALDNQNWAKTIYEQIARQFAYLNFGDAELAPWTWWDVKSPEEYANSFKAFQAFGTGVEVLRRGGVEFDDPEEVAAWASSELGLHNLPKFKIVPPVAGGGGASK